MRSVVRKQDSGVLVLIDWGVKSLTAYKTTLLLLKGSSSYFHKFKDYFTLHGKYPTHGNKSTSLSKIIYRKNFLGLLDISVA